MPATKYNQEVGNHAESVAMQYLYSKGFTKQKQNYRFKRAEVDLIVQKKDLLLFIEIKLRSNIKFGYPENFVNTKQQELYQLAASAYIEKAAWQGDIRFDVIAFQKIGKKLHLTHFEDAFY